MRLPAEAERQRVLESAFDQGVRHFDAARMYGLGKVEGIVGTFARPRRDQVTITSKFGIQLNAYATRFSGIQTLVRRILALNPALRQIARRRSQALYKEQAFSMEDARLSLETSLRELQTDYIDIYLLHECTAAGLRQGDDLLSFLQDARQAGKIFAAMALPRNSQTRWTSAASFPSTPRSCSLRTMPLSVLWKRCRAGPSGL